ncbi:hypothetical protein A2110_02635 [Candidatus Jorgensenbacteria bacterium GWA1_54_12]|uniref:Uncharacterized protein n=1 Tax=Candidatus Jorgensenbacteria bacterium GWA1_54_12 TaxID=1798468 RepID=A0A1F6BKU2_9BACT|nr:MAG: hypothetical protein A2110_02635 [Candidatus Jorgensenbacteria bacterium GWA1_54_12]
MRENDAFPQLLKRVLSLEYDVLDRHEPLEHLPQSFRGFFPLRSPIGVSKKECVECFSSGGKTGYLAMC